MLSSSDPASAARASGWEGKRLLQQICNLLAQSHYFYCEWQIRDEKAPYATVLSFPGKK